MKFLKNILLNYYKNKVLELSDKDIPNKVAIMDEYQAKIVKYSPFFDKKYYKDTYNIGDNVYLALDYLKEGYKKGYNPSLRFDTSGYLSLYEDVKKSGLNPLVHYELYGRSELRKTGIKSIYEGSYHTYKKIRLFWRYLGRLVNFFRIKKNKDCKILVILHMFYMQSNKEIIEYLKNLSCYDYDLIITYMDGYYDDLYLNEFKKFKRNAKLIKCENKGYDIGPFIHVLNDINLNKYDIVLKLQSKSTTKNIFIYNQFFSGRDWFTNLYKGILGPFSVHKMVNKLYNDRNCGLVASKNLIVKDPKHKQELVKEGLSKIKNVKFLENYDFVAGSCFAVKAKCLKEVQKLKLTLNDFEVTNRGFFSLGHVMERVICFIVANQNYKLYGIRTCLYRHLKWFRLERKLQYYSALNLVKRDDVLFSADFIWHTLEMMFIRDAKIINIPLKEIKREWFDGTIMNLQDCAPYQYLNGNVEKYQKYVNYHKENNLPVMSVKRYEKIIKSIKRNGYDNKHLIVINEKNIILDGQHRACILCYLFGEDKEIKVLKLEVLNIDLNKVKTFSSKINLI